MTEKQLQELVLQEKPENRVVIAVHIPEFFEKEFYLIMHVYAEKIRKANNPFDKIQALKTLTSRLACFMSFAARYGYQIQPALVQDMAWLSKIVNVEAVTLDQVKAWYESEMSYTRKVYGDNLESAKQRKDAYEIKLWTAKLVNRSYIMKYIGERISLFTDNQGKLF